MITAEELRRVIRYDPKTGKFYWRRNRYTGKPPRLTIKAGTEAGHLTEADGRRRIGITTDKKRLYLASRLAWLYMTGRWPEHEVDHEDRDRDNNRWLNLRDATRLQNAANRGVQCNSRTGVAGVNHYGDRFVARIKRRGRTFHLGYYPSLEKAVAARRSAERRYSV